jgi:hypothetical protein
VATELPRRLEDAGQREALGLVLEILEMEAEAREQRKIARLRRAAQLPPGKTWETLDHNVLPPALMRKLREIARRRLSGACAQRTSFRSARSNDIMPTSLYP